MAAVRVVVVDDHGACRRALADVAAAAGFEVVGSADSGEAAVSAVTAVAPDLVLMDVRMPGQGGRAAANVIAALAPDVVVQLVSETPRWGDGDVLAKSELTPDRLRDLWRVRAPAHRSHRLPADVRDRSLGAR